MNSCYGGGEAVNARIQNFEAIRRGLDTWDYQWVFCRWVNSALTIVPCVNMIQNIGFGPNATHTFDKPESEKLRKAENISFPLAHPSLVIRDAAQELTLAKKSSLIIQIVKHIRKKILTIVRKQYRSN